MCSNFFSQSTCYWLGFGYVFEPYTEMLRGLLSSACETVPWWGSDYEVILSYFGFWVMPSCAQGLFLALCSQTSPGKIQEILCGSGDETWVSWVQDKCLTCCIIYLSSNPMKPFELYLDPTGFLS